MMMMVVDWWWLCVCEFLHHCKVIILSELKHWGLVKHLLNLLTDDILICCEQ